MHSQLTRIPGPIFDTVTNFQLNLTTLKFGGVGCGCGHFPYLSDVGNLIFDFFIHFYILVSIFVGIWRQWNFEGWGMGVVEGFIFMVWDHYFRIRRSIFAAGINFHLNLTRLKFCWGGVWVWSFPIIFGSRDLDFRFSRPFLHTGTNFQVNLTTMKFWGVGHGCGRNTNSGLFQVIPTNPSKFRVIPVNLKYFWLIQIGSV